MKLTNRKTLWIALDDNLEPLDGLVFDSLYHLRTTIAYAKKKNARKTICVVEVSLKKAKRMTVEVSNLGIVKE